MKTTAKVLKTRARETKRIAAQVYLLWHTDQDEDDKLIGVYTKKSLASQALKRTRKKPGFSQKGGVFEIADYDLDRDYWTSGFHRVDGHNLPTWFQPNPTLTKANKSKSQK